MESCSQPQSFPQFGVKAVRRKKRSIRIPMRWLAIVAIGFGIAAGISVCLAGNFAHVLVRQARDAYLVHRLTAERDALALNNGMLQQQLAAVREESSEGEGFESLVKNRLDELQTIIESSTSIKVFKDKRNGAKPVVITKDQKNQKNPNALAALLDAPELKGLSKGADKPMEPEFLDELKQLNKGLGGAEVECRRNPAGKVVCATSVDTETEPTDPKTAQEVKVLEQEQSGALTAEQWSGDQRALLERLTHYTALLRSLPMGTPVEGELTSKFGRRASPFSGRSSFHEGLDISLDNGSKVQVTGDGVVSKVEYDSTYGWLIDVTHTHDITTRYAHLSKVLVKEGRRVRRGDLIAYSGSTGRSTGPHLHYEVRLRGMPKNPMPFLALVDKLHKFL
jgi:murein DD-endopeptidase MepM/ murein hydrolase activator NlpD